MAAVDDEHLRTAASAMNQANVYIQEQRFITAEALLSKAVERFPDNQDLRVQFGEFYLAREQWGAAQVQLEAAQMFGTRPDIEKHLNDLDERFEKLTSSYNRSFSYAQRATNDGFFDTTIAITDIAIQKYPDRDALYNERARALLEKGLLDEAENDAMRATQLNPKNEEAFRLVEAIRARRQAQTSEELQEWISIAKDKVGDFIVTFLALFMAFVTNSLIEPVMLRIKLNNARRLFDKGDYDEFTDLIEGLLDEENFSPIRKNFQFLLNQKSYDEARDILNKYVNTPDRLPTLLRILERENEKLAAN
ncbi:MAG: tetratricopeptide repeat protein [Pseudomonadota bacterium]